ncbi:MAG: hypothetical protein Q8K59_02095 [Nitrosomonas sp.]|nr:hypothetical protein [Nitrosomonas sp.]
MVSNSFFKKNLIRVLLEKQVILPITVWIHLVNAGIRAGTGNDDRGIRKKIRRPIVEGYSRKG